VAQSLPELGDAGHRMIRCDLVELADSPVGAFPPHQLVKDLVGVNCSMRLMLTPPPD